MTIKTVTPQLLAKLAAEQQNAWGRVTLENIVIDCVFPSGKGLSFELQIEPGIIMKGQATDLTPGVFYNPEYYGHPIFCDDDMEDIGEVVAYAINEGKVTADTVDGIAWSVRDVQPLKDWGVI